MACELRSIMSRKVSIAGSGFPCAFEEAQEGRPLTDSDLLRLLAGGVYCSRVSTLVRERGIAFSPTERELELLQHAGADDELQRAVVQAQGTRPGGRDPLEPAEDETSHHMASGEWKLALALRRSLLEVSEASRRALASGM